MIEVSLWWFGDVSSEVEKECVSVLKMRNTWMCPEVMPEVLTKAPS